LVGGTGADRLRFIEDTHYIFLSPDPIHDSDWLADYNPAEGDIKLYPA
jgi:hypothetical protein